MLDWLFQDGRVVLLAIAILVAEMAFFRLVPRSARAGFLANSARTRLEDMSGFMALPLFAPDHRQVLATCQMHLGGVTSHFFSAHEYRMLVTGAKDFSLNGRLMPWDHAPGQLPHAEAGGHSAMCDGRAYRPTYREGPFLLAPDLESWNELNEHTCKWPNGDPLSEDFSFCGNDVGEGGPYCSYHARLAYQPASERRKGR